MDLNEIYTLGGLFKKKPRVEQKTLSFQDSNKQLADSVFSSVAAGRNSSDQVQAAPRQNTNLLTTDDPSAAAPGTIAWALQQAKRASLNSGYNSDGKTWPQSRITPLKANQDSLFTSLPGDGSGAMGADGRRRAGPFEPQVHYGLDGTVRQGATGPGFDTRTVGVGQGPDALKFGESVGSRAIADGQLASLRQTLTSGISSGKQKRNAATALDAITAQDQEKNIDKSNTLASLLASKRLGLDEHQNSFANTLATNRFGLDERAAGREDKLADITARSGEVALKGAQTQQSLIDTLLDPKATSEQRTSAIGTLRALTGKTDKEFAVSGGTNEFGAPVPGAVYDPETKNFRYQSPPTAPPSADEFVKLAKEANPTMSDDQLKAIYKKKYGR